MWRTNMLRGRTEESSPWRRPRGCLTPGDFRMTEGVVSIGWPQTREACHPSVASWVAGPMTRCVMRSREDGRGWRLGGGGGLPRIAKASRSRFLDNSVEEGRP